MHLRDCKFCRTKNKNIKIQSSFLSIFSQSIKLIKTIHFLPKITMEAQPTSLCHMVAMPFPVRGNINPMMNLCKLLVSNNSNIHVTFVVTEEWLSFISSDPKPDNISLCSIPNVIPSELIRSRDHPAFVEDVMTKMEAPFEELLDQLYHPPSIIVYDTLLYWAVVVANRRNIPAALFWPMPTSIFSVFLHQHLFEQNGHYPVKYPGNRIQYSNNI